MVLNKIPTFDEVKNWVNANTATSVNGETGDVTVDTSSPITSKDSAETFSESDVTITTTDTTVNGESIELNGIDASASTDTQSYGTNGAGIEIPFTANANGVFISSITIDTRSSDKFKFEIQDEGGNVIAVKYADLGDGVNYTQNINLSDYSELFYNGDTGKIVVSGGRLNVTVTGTQSNALFEFSDSRLPYASAAGETIKAEKVNLSGSATIEWPVPNDIYNWDTATFTRTENNETVSVYIEESTDGGSTWTEIQGPISRNDEIQAVADSRVRFRVELSASKWINNPTLDSIYRRWVV